MVGRTCGRGSSKGIMLASDMVIEYNLSHERQAQTEKKDANHPNHLSLESPGDAFAGKTTPILCQLPLGLSRRDRLEGGGDCPMGVAGPGRTPLASTAQATSNDAPPSCEKTIITDVLGRKP